MSAAFPTAPFIRSSQRMTDNRPHQKSDYQPRSAHPLLKKELTDYSMPRAFTRISFYLDVLEAHFQKLGALLEAANADGKTTIPHPVPRQEVSGKRGAGQQLTV
jgi:hypothetical protein